MRIDITLEQMRGEKQVIGLNYNYAVYRMIYSLISAGSPEQAERLHNTGFGKGEKRFRFFSFSRLGVKRKRLEDASDGSGRKMLRLISREVNLTISTASHLTYQALMKGLFKKREVRMAGPGWEARFRAGMFIHHEWAGIPSDNFDGWVRKKTRRGLVSPNEVRFKLMSPVVVSRKRIRKGVPHKMREREEYLHPHDEVYEKYLKRNLLEKFYTYLQVTGQSIEKYESLYRKGILLERLRVMGNPKEKLITIKEGCKAETRVKGYLYEGLEARGHEDVINFLYDAGAGKMNSLGFGCLEINY